MSTIALSQLPGESHDDNDEDDNDHGQGDHDLGSGQVHARLTDAPRGEKGRLVWLSSHSIPDFNDNKAS